MKRSAPFGIHWFRRDLRVQGNPALAWNQREHEGRVVGLFCIDRKFLARDDFSPTRFAFFLETLAALRSELKALGGDLLVLGDGPQESFSRVLRALGEPRPATVSFNRDYEPFALERDAQMTRLLEHAGMRVHTERDHLLIEPQEISKNDKASPYYKVYTPFRKRWIERLASSEVQERLASELIPSKRFALTWDALGITLEDKLGEWQKATDPARQIIDLPTAGHAAALKRMSAFGRGAVEHYANERDYPAKTATSRLSVYLKNGSLTTARVISELGLARGKPSKFLDELIWREFYYHILSHWPHVEGGAFNPKYAELEWENDEHLFRAWQEGRTGYPIVDAGMRELAATGFMHNRVRMIVASFLTKDLLIDWRWGERHFMRLLIDGDLAANNGGWQWAASTGCDPQPYFRVFNPIEQGKKFDADGEYIKKWVPELAKLAPKELHRPHSPIVDHASRRLKALRLYRA